MRSWCIQEEKGPHESRKDHGLATDISRMYMEQKLDEVLARRESRLYPMSHVLKGNHDNHALCSESSEKRYTTSTNRGR